MIQTGKKKEEIGGLANGCKTYRMYLLMLQTLRPQPESVGQEWDTSSIYFLRGASDPQLFKVRLCWPDSLFMWAYAECLHWNGLVGLQCTSENSQPP